MPKGLMFILIVNLAGLVLSAFGVYLQLIAGTPAPGVVLVGGVTAIGLVVVELAILCRRAGGLKLARIALYAIMLVQGFLLLLLLRRLFSGDGIAAFVMTLVFLIYLVGARGYLNETEARRYAVR